MTVAILGTSIRQGSVTNPRSAIRTCTRNLWRWKTVAWNVSWTCRSGGWRTRPHLMDFRAFETFSRAQTIHLGRDQVLIVQIDFANGSQRLVRWWTHWACLAAWPFGLAQSTSVSSTIDCPSDCQRIVCKVGKASIIGKFPVVVLHQILEVLMLVDGSQARSS